MRAMNVALAALASQRRDGRNEESYADKVARWHRRVTEMRLEGIARIFAETQAEIEVFGHVTPDL